MATPSTVQALNQQVAQRILAESRGNPQSPYTGKFIGLASGQVVVVADNWDELAQRLRQIEPDPQKAYCFEVGADYSAVPARREWRGAVSGWQVRPNRGFEWRGPHLGRGDREGAEPLLPHSLGKPGRAGTIRPRRRGAGCPGARRSVCLVSRWGRISLPVGYYQGQTGGLLPLQLIVPLQHRGFF